MHDLLDQVTSHLKAAWQYRWYAVIVAWSVAVIGWGVVYKMPDRYEASARVYVDTQSVLRPLLAGLAVQPNIDQQVSMMSRTLISRPNLEKVIRMADMDIKLKTTDERDTRIAHLMKELTIKSAGRENLYTIAYSDPNPQEAKRVVQSLLTIFVEGSLGDKRKDSDTARRFLDDQLKAYSEKLVAAENSVTEFKRKNVGLMPKDGRDYYTRLGESKSALSQAELELKEAENGRDAIKRQLAGVGESEAPPNLLEGNKGASPDSAVEQSHPEIDARIQTLQTKLDALRLSYTEQHPDIIVLLRVIDQLREQKRAELKNRKPSPSMPSMSAAQMQNPIHQQLAVSLASAEASVASMKARVAEYTRRYTELRDAVNKLPQVEAEYAQLTRDYDVLKTNYEKLLGRRESAQMSSEMEASANVIDFRVIDPPQVPLMPNAPNRRILMSLVLVGALVGGAGLAFLLSQLRPTFSDERRLREISGLPVFGTVAMAWGPLEMAKRRKRLIAFLVSLVSLFSAYGAIMAALMLSARA